LGCELHPRIPGSPGAAKLTNPTPEFAAAAAKPLGKEFPPNPPPKEVNGDIPAAANGDDEKALEVGAFPCVPEGDVSTGCLKDKAVAADRPRAPKGDWSDLANAAKLDEAKADEEVT